MQIGTIEQIVPAGGYNSQNGYIYTFNIAINTPSGKVTGEIGSKAQVYPLVPGNEINFEVRNTSNGIKIKKINPQYAQQNAAPPQNQPWQPPPQQQTPPQQPPQAQGRDFDKENRGKCRFGFYQALLASTTAVGLTNDSEEIKAVELLVGWAMNGVPIAPPQSFNQFAEEADAQDFPPDPNDY